MLHLLALLECLYLWKTVIPEPFFGDYVSIYDIQDAVDDGEIVPIYYESQFAKLDVDRYEIEELSNQVEELSNQVEELSNQVEEADGDYMASGKLSTLIIT